MNYRRKVFVECYLHCWNATEAAIQAGYSPTSAHDTGSGLLKKPEIVREIERRLAEFKGSADEVLTRLTSHARGSMETFIDLQPDGSASIDLNKAQAAGALHLIKKMKTTSRRRGDVVEITNEIELYDAQSALEKIGRAQGLFVDRTESKTNGALTVRVIYERRGNQADRTASDTAGDSENGEPL